MTATHDYVARITTQTGAAADTIDFNDPNGDWFISIEDERITVDSNGLTHETHLIYSAKTTTGPNFAAQQTALADVFRQVPLWHQDEHNSKAFYWEFYLSPGEEPKRYLLHSCTITAHSTVYEDSRYRRSNQDRQAVYIELVRESVAEEITTTNATASGLGFDEAIAIAANHDTDTRLSHLAIIPASGDFNKIWIGIRPPYGDEDPATSDFLTNNTFDISTTTTLTSSLALIDELLFSDLTTVDITHLFGEYRLLCRMKATDSTLQATVQLYHGTSGANPRSKDDYGMVANEPVFIDADDTSYHIVDLGTMRLPAIPLRHNVLDEFDDDATLFGSIKNGTYILIYARRDAGSGELTFGDLILMPSRHSAYIDNADVEYVATENQRQVIITASDGSVSSVSHGKQVSILADTFPVPTPITSNNFFIPATGGCLKIVTSSDGSFTAYDVNIDMEKRGLW
jgi:hypothetical protein